MADEPGFGVVDDGCEVFGAEGLYCMDWSVIPTSLGVNPSLTISAVCERAAAGLVARAADFGLPSAPAGFKHRAPGVHVGERVKPEGSGAQSIQASCQSARKTRAVSETRALPLPYKISAAAQATSPDHPPPPPSLLPFACPRGRRPPSKYRAERPL